MRTRKTQGAAALLLVGVSLLLATMACYSGQIPGVFELTPFYTPTPLADPEDARFEELQLVLAPREAGRTFFNLTVDPEPLRDSLVNSKTMCQGDSAARVLYAGVDHHGDTYYLINCVGSVGWVVEDRLAGPLLFAQDDLAITVVPEGGVGQAVELLDDAFRPLPFNPLQSCKPETVVRVSDLIAADPDNDGEKTIYYQIDCPTSGGPLKGWVTNKDLFGPVPINVDERAVARNTPDQAFQLSSEPAPPTAENAVDGACSAGDILTALEVHLVDDQVYYRVSCGEVDGWVTPEMFVGPLQYDIGVNVVVYVPPVPIFADEQVAGGVADVEGEPGDVVDDAADPAIAGDVVERTSAQGREVIQITPPLYLTENPGPADVTGEDANVVAECSSGSVASIEEYAAVDEIYYQIVCNECTVGENDVITCEEYTGWADQQYLEGPVDFVIGQRVAFADRSAAVETDEDGVTWARIPPNIASAGTIGSYTEFTGRCVRDEGMEVTGIVLEKDRTRNRFSFFYEVQCTGQPSTITQEQEGNIVRPKVIYNDEEALITGYASGRDLVALEE